VAWPWGFRLVFGHGGTIEMTGLSMENHGDDIIMAFNIDFMV